MSGAGNESEVRPSAIRLLARRAGNLLCSLKLAVVVILSLAFALALGTILESEYDTPTAQYWVYRSVWFHVVLATLGVNIFSVMVDRWPWKKKHAPFLLAHIGILTLLAGSWITERYGLDGSIRIGEGERSAIVEEDTPGLVLSDRVTAHRIDIPWQPPSVKFKPVLVADYGLPYDLVVDRYLSHADPVFSFVPMPAGAPGHPRQPAVQLRIKGGPMGISQEMWLWGGDRSWRDVQMGPARFVLGDPAPEDLRPGARGPKLYVMPRPDGSVAYRAIGSDGHVVTGEVRVAQLKGYVIDPGWKGVKLTLLDEVQDAVARTTYEPARMQYGQNAPPSAIHVAAGLGGDGAETWLGLGDRAIMRAGAQEVEIGYFPHRSILPFQIELQRFNIDRYQGSMDPASYFSIVKVRDSSRPPNEDIKISMNEPLTYKGITFYQASYEDAQPRPTVSIFSVNRDPGRPWKYLGSLLIVVGSILLFAARYRGARVARKLQQELLLKQQREASAHPAPNEQMEVASL